MKMTTALLLPLIGAITLVFEGGAYASDKKTCSVALKDSSHATPTAAAGAGKTAGLQGPQSPYEFSQLYVKVIKTLQGEKNPFSSAMGNPNTIGQAHLDLGAALPVYREIYFHYHNSQRLPEKDFQRLYKTLAHEIQTLQPQSLSAKKFALLEGLRVLQLLETKVEQKLISTTQDDAQKGKSPQEKDQNQKEDQSLTKEGKNGTPQEQEEQKDEEYSWNPPPEKYDPENKNLGSKSKGPKAQIILRSDVITTNRFYPRIRYDVINQNGFFAVPLVRPTPLKEPALKPHDATNFIYLKFDRKTQIIEDFPVPDGFRVLTGVYAGYQVRETAPQQYSLMITQDPQSLAEELAVGITPLRAFDASNAQGLESYAQPTGLNKDLWPEALKHRVTEIGRKFSSPLAIALALSSYLAGNDFIYFSEGNLVNATEFAKLQADYQKLLQRYPKAIAMAHLKSFNCDGAAYIATALLRDFFGIRSRVVGGATAETGLLQRGAQMFEVISSNSPAHAWIEVWDSSSRTWMAFDPTPKRNTPHSAETPSLQLKSRQEQQKNQGTDENSPSGSRSSSSDQDDSTKTDDQDQSSEGSSPESASESKKQSSPKEVEAKKAKAEGSVTDEMQRDSSPMRELTPEELAHAKKNTTPHSKPPSKESNKEPTSTPSTSPSKDSPQNTHTPAEGELLPTPSEGTTSGKKLSEAHSEGGRSVERQFETRKLKSQKRIHQNLSDRLFEAFYAYYLREGINTGFHTPFKNYFDGQLTQFLNNFRYVTDAQKRENQAYFLKKMDLQGSLSPEASKDLMSRFRSMSSNNSSGHLNRTWKELKALQLQYDELRLSRDLTAKETEFYYQLQKVMAEFQHIKHKDSSSNELCERLVEKLPGSISRSLLHAKYPDYKVLGSLDSKSLAQNILSGHETDLIRLALASPYTDLFLNSEQIPQFKDMRTFDRTLDPNNPRDVIRTRRLSDFPRMILQPKPGEHLFSDTIRGEQMALGYTETRQIPNPKKVIEKKVSVVYYDVSGSMRGPRLALQDALIMAFVDRALSEMDSLHRPIHKVFMVPFDDGMGETVEISTREEAEQLIKLQRISRKTNGQGATEIEPVLLDFYSKVDLAHSLDKQKTNRSLAQLKKANLVLFSDGGSNVNYDTIKRRQEQVAEKTGITMHLSFVSIEDENDILRRLATGISSTAGRSTYYHINTKRMNDILNGMELRRENPEAFAFDERDAVPTSLLREFEKLKQLASPEAMVFDFNEFERILQSLKTRPSDHEEDIELTASILDLRDTMTYVMKDQEAPLNLKLVLVETALKSYLASLDRNPNDLTEVEVKMLNQLVRMRKRP